MFALLEKYDCVYLENVSVLKWNVMPLIRRGRNFFLCSTSCNIHYNLNKYTLSITHPSTNTIYSREIYSENIFNPLIWLTLLLSCDITYTCHGFPYKLRLLYWEMIWRVKLPKVIFFLTLSINLRIRKQIRFDIFF